jgi:hypothetical protein
MSVFNRKFSMGEIRGGMIGIKTGKSESSIKIIRKTNKINLSSLNELSFDKTDSRDIETKLIKKKDTIESKDLSTFDTVTKISNIRKVKRVKFTEPFIEVVQIESFKKYYLEPQSSKKKQAQSCRCLIF